LIDGGHLRADYKTMDIASACKIDKELLDNAELYFLDVRFYSYSEDKETEIFKSQRGVLSWETLCNLEVEEQGKLPSCYEKEVYALDENNLKVKIKVIAASNQEGKSLI